MVIVHDPTGLAGAALTMSIPALQLLALMDGQNTRPQILEGFSQTFGHTLAPAVLDQLIDQLDAAHFLDSPAFARYYGQLVEDYLAAPVRPMNHVAGLGLDPDDVAAGMEQMFPWSTQVRRAGRLRGLIAPHLDYPRGRPCYIEAYSRLLGEGHRRFVILGTNHFGHSPAVVSTSKDFATPLGTTAVDRDLLERLERRVGGSLRTHELDHRREHSVELQVLILQHLFGADNIRIVPFLCPDPCGPTGTAPLYGDGVDLTTFAAALADELAGDGTDTCLIAGADLSHVGGFFGDNEVLSEEFLERVRVRDAEALSEVVANQPEAFRARVAREGNPTRICSAGCIYTLMAALPGARARQLGYHQAVNHENQCSVSCAAIVFEE